MASEIHWSEESANDLQSIFEFIARDSEEDARRVIKRITTATDPLLRFPFMGRVVPEYRNQSLRELIVYRYRVIYLVMADGVNIVGVIHGARRLKGALKGRTVKPT